MARVVFNVDERDPQFQIEDGIRRTLETAPVASTPQTAIDKCYDLEDEDGEAVDGSLDAKCQQLANRLNLDFSLTDDLVVFRPKRGTGSASSWTTND